MNNESRATHSNTRFKIGNTLPLNIDHLWLALPIIAGIIIGFRRRLPLLDFWWHLRVGDLILDTKTVPRVDEFSFTAAGSPFVLQNWLAEILYSLVHRIGGFETLIFCNTLVLCSALLLVYSLCLQATGRIRPAALCMGLTLVVMPAFSWVRPQAFSIFFFALFLWVLTAWSHRNGRNLWLIPISMLIWVNLHGAFVLGLGLIVLFLVSEALRRASLGEQPDTLPFKAIGRLLLVLILACLATLANPEFHRVFEYVLTITRDPGVRLYLAEWQPPAITRIDGILCFYLPFLLSLLVLLYSRRRLNLTDLLLYLSFAVFALMSLRNGIWFALVVPPIIAKSLVNLSYPRVTAPVVSRLFVRKDTGSKPPKSRRALDFMMAVIMLVALVTNSPWVFSRLSKKPVWNPDTPLAAMDYIDEHDLDGKIFHPQSYGDYLIWRLWPKQRTYIDGRIHVFGRDHVEDYLTIFFDTCWEQRLGEQEIQYLLLAKTEGLSRELAEKANDSAQWKQLYEDELSFIYERVEPAR